MKIQEEKLAGYIREISSGNEDALMQFYNEHGRSILAMILSIVKSREAAEEVLQDVMMSIVRYGSSKPIKNAKAWLFTVIRNTSVSRAEQEQAMQNNILPADETEICDEQSFDKIENGVDQIEALRCLDSIELQCVMMYVFGKMNMHEVAKALELPYNKTRDKYYYALKKLRKYYDERK